MPYYLVSKFNPLESCPNYLLFKRFSKALLKYLKSIFSSNLTSPTAPLKDTAPHTKI